MLLVELLDITKCVGENRSLQDEEDIVDEKEKFTELGGLLVTTPKNEMQSIESIILKSARANKGPIFPKVFRRIKNHFFPQLGIDKDHGRRRDSSISHSEVEIFASSIKDAISRNVKNIVRGRDYIGNNHAWKVDQSRMDQPALTIRSVVKKESVLVRTATHRSIENKDVQIQSMPLKFLINSTEVKEMLKSSMKTVLKQSKESSEILRRKVNINVDEVSTAGIGKLDRGQEAINVIGDFAKGKLRSMGKRVCGVTTEKWSNRRS